MIVTQLPFEGVRVRMRVRVSVSLCVKPCMTGENDEVCAVCMHGLTFNLGTY
jgi:hypothetical protein